MQRRQGIRFDAQLPWIHPTVACRQIYERVIAPLQPFCNFDAYREWYANLESDRLHHRLLHYLDERLNLLAGGQVVRRVDVHGLTGMPVSKGTELDRLDQPAWYPHPR